MVTGLWRCQLGGVFAVMEVVAARRRRGRRVIVVVCVIDGDVG